MYGWFCVCTTFSVPSSSVLRALALYAVCQQLIGEVVLVFTMLEVDFHWHLGGKNKLCEEMTDKPATETVTLCMYVQIDSYSGYIVF